MGSWSWEREPSSYGLSIQSHACCGSDPWNLPSGHLNMESRALLLGLSSVFRLASVHLEESQGRRLQMDMEEGTDEDAFPEP